MSARGLEGKRAIDAGGLLMPKCVKCRKAHIEIFYRQKIPSDIYCYGLA